MKNIKNIFTNILKKLRKITSKFLSVLKENKNISVSILILILLVSVGIIITYSYFRLSNENNIFTGSADYYANPDLNIKYMIENRNAEGSGDGSYTAYWSAPVAGYTYNAEKSNCSNGATFIKSDVGDDFTITSKGKTTCEFFYEANDDAVVADTSLEIYKENKTTGEYELAYDYKLETLLNGAYEFNSELSTCENGSIALDAVSKKIVMTSTSVNNCKAYFDLGTSEYGFTGDYQKFTALNSGYYKFEAWGASGSPFEDYEGGKGAYNAGEIYLEQGETFYVYVGANNENFNNGYNIENNNDALGGGATDFRLTSGEWNDNLGLNSRILVSGGGGGGYNYIDNGYRGGHAGGLVAETTKSFNWTTGIYDSINAGANQLNGGIDNKDTGGVAEYSYPGFFGSGHWRGTGSGYYGGVYYWFSGRLYSKGGGSSFISGHTGAVAITSETDRSPRGIDFDIRYIEIGSNENTNAVGNHIVELQAFDVNGNNVALNKVVTSPNYVENSARPFSNIVNNVYNNPMENAWVGTSTTVDLGAEYYLSSIKLWRYYEDSRTYYETYVKVYNADKTKWAYLHNYEIDGTYAETSIGKEMQLTCTTGITDKLCSHHYSGYIFDNTVMIDGAGYNWTNEKGSQVAMPNPAGGIYPLGTGHTGNGYAKITYIGE